MLCYPHMELTRTQTPHMTATLGNKPKVNPDIKNFFLNVYVLNWVANPKYENLKNENLR